MFCTKCGTQLYESARFCHKCGNEMIPYNAVEQSGDLEQKKTEDTEEEYLTKEELYYHSNFRNYRIELLVVGIIMAIIGILGAEIFFLQNEKGQALIFLGVFLALDACLCCATCKCDFLFFLGYVLFYIGRGLYYIYKYDYFETSTGNWRGLWYVCIAVVFIMLFRFEVIYRRYRKNKKIAYFFV